jgi:hypothetical protein
LQHKAIDACLLRTQRESQADLALSLDDGVGQHAVDSQTCKQQSADGEQNQEVHLEAAVRHRVCDDATEGTDGWDGDFGIDAPDGFANGVGHHRWVLVGIDEQSTGVIALVPVRHIDHHGVGSGERDGSGVSHDANHCKGWFVTSTSGELLADGIFPGPEGSGSEL